MNELPVPPETLRRRHLLGRGAALAGTAAGALAIGVIGSQPASAATGDTLKQGGKFTGGSTTTLGGGSSTTPALELTNASGPALTLTSLGDGSSFDFGNLGPGDLVAIDERPVAGASDDLGPYAVGLATLADLADLSLPRAISSTRVVDTRSSSGRTNIIATGGGGLDSSGKLKGGAYMDLRIGDAAGDTYLDAAFLNLTSVSSEAVGYLFAYPPVSPRPAGSTTSYSKGVTTASSCLAALGVVGTSFAVRIYSSVTSHVIVDVTGYLQADVPGPLATEKVRRTARRSVARRVGSKVRARHR